MGNEQRYYLSFTIVIFLFIFSIVFSYQNFYTKKRQDFIKSGYIYTVIPGNCNQVWLKPDSKYLQ